MDKKEQNGEDSIGLSQFHKIERFFVYNINSIVQIFNALFRKPESYPA